MSDFPSIHSKTFEKYRNSIISTGESILNRPSMDIDISDYANLVDKDGFTKIGGILFQFKKSTIKASKVENAVTTKDIENLKKALKSDSNVKIITANKASNKSSKIMQNGVESTEGGYGGYLVRGTVEYSDSYTFGNSSSPGAVYVSFFGLDIWLVPSVHFHTNMCVLKPSFWGWTLTGADGMNVYINSNLNINNPFGTTDNDGNFSKDSYKEGYVSDIHIINAGFYLTFYGNSIFTCSIFKYL